MYVMVLVLEILIQMEDSINIITNRFNPIESPDDFTDSDSGMEKLDAICMKLIAIGESLKKIDKMTDRTLLYQFKEIDWRKIIGMRDIISHHYFDLDAEIIFDVCENHTKNLAKTRNRIIKKLS